MKDKIIFIISMFIFGTIGIFRKFIPLDSAVISFSRGVIGTLFLVLFLLIRKDEINLKELKKYSLLLIVSGCLIGINWLFLFESYKYTSVATSTLCYYMAPIFVMFASPFVFKEKLNVVNIVCMMLAFIGMVFVSGVFETGLNDKNTIIGVLYGLAAAVFYAIVVIINKKIKVENAFYKTLIQLFFSAIILIPYLIINRSFDGTELNFKVLILILIVGIIHTGIAYVLYFGSMTKVKTQFISLFSYVDPVVAIILSAIILKEQMTLLGIIGAVLILGASLFMEVYEVKQKVKSE
ncbi:MAG: EamA/RhaT family transporter [Erysipelotrichaceae bacterium]|nr:EamA/RhaT family transporter [Erysipelotrichaceae bacterium]